MRAEQVLHPAWASRISDIDDDQPFHEPLQRFGITGGLQSNPVCFRFVATRNRVLKRRGCEKEQQRDEQSEWYERGVRGTTRAHAFQ